MAFILIGNRYNVLKIVTLMGRYTLMNEYRGRTVLKLAGCCAVVALMVAGCSRTPRDPVGHSVKVHEKPWRNDIAPTAAAVQVGSLPDGPRTLMAKHGESTAFIVRNQSGMNSILNESVQLDTVYYVLNGKCYRVDGIPLANKPITGLAWCDGRYLQFDRNYQPGFGIHYLVDTQSGTVVNTSPFPEVAPASRPASK